MVSRRLISFILTASLLTTSGPVFAHHGQVEYEGKAVTLKGTVTKFEWTNPHCIVAVTVKNGKDKVEQWYAEFLPPAQMSRGGWTRDSIKPEDQVTLIGRPGKKGEHIMWIESLVLPDGRKIDRDSASR